ncbi:hypothetical protein OROGR_008456 [Orobanche gracilis]
MVFILSGVDMKSKNTPKPTYTHRNSHTHTETHTHRHPRLASARRPGIQTAKTQGVQQRVWRRRDDGFTEATIQLFNLISIQVSGSFHFLCNLRFEDLNLVEVQVGFTVMAREGVVSDGINALMRYYLNNFVDGTKQAFKGAWFILPWDFLEWKGSNHSFELSRAMWDYSFQILYKRERENDIIKVNKRKRWSKAKSQGEDFIEWFKEERTDNYNDAGMLALGISNEEKMHLRQKLLMHLREENDHAELLSKGYGFNEQDFDKDDVVGSEEPTERDHGVDLQQPLLIEIVASDSHQK